MHCLWYCVVRRSWRNLCVPVCSWNNNKTSLTPTLITCRSNASFLSKITFPWCKCAQSLEDSVALADKSVLISFSVCYELWWRSGTEKASLVPCEWLGLYLYKWRSARRLTVFIFSIAHIPNLRWIQQLNVIVISFISIISLEFIQSLIRLKGTGIRTQREYGRRLNVPLMSLNFNHQRFLLCYFLVEGQKGLSQTDSYHTVISYREPISFM